jgi:hypothetical protein
MGALLQVTKQQRCKNGDCLVLSNNEHSFVLQRRRQYHITKHTLHRLIPYVLFFVEKKEPKKATVKRYTARLTDTSLCNDGTTVASAIGSLYITLTMCTNMIPKYRLQ